MTCQMTRAWRWPADIPAHAVSSEAIAAVIAFLVSDAAALVSGAIIRAYGTRPTAQAMSPARAAVQSSAMAKAGRSQQIHGCRRRTGAAVLRCCGASVARITRIR